MNITEPQVSAAFLDVREMNEPDGIDVTGVSFLLEEGDTAWGPDGEIEGPASVSYQWTGGGFEVEVDSV